MRDIRDAKAMAQTLRQELAAKAVTISHGESLELISHLFGVADWNTLSALPRAGQAKAADDQARTATAVFPAIPVRDMVPFPVVALPLWLKRDKTLRALDAAFAVQRQVVLVAQKSPLVDDPGADDVYAVGALARVLDMGAPSEEALAQRPELAGTTEVLMQPHRRVNLLSFTGSAGAYQAEIEETHEGPFPSAPDLIRTAAACFEQHAAAHGIPLSGQWATGRPVRDPGRFADLLALSARISLAEKQRLLETVDPVARLEALVTMIRTN